MKSIRYPLLLGALALAVTAAGCGKKDTAAPAASQGQTKQTQGSAAGSGANKESSDVQSRKDKQLFVVFQALLQMDKKDGLAITQEQAKSLLPIVKNSKDKGELSADDQQKIEGLLTAEQKQFLTDFMDKVKNNRNNAKNLSPAERDKMANDFKNQRKQTGDANGGTHNGDNNVNNSDEVNGTDNGTKADDNGNAETNSGQRNGPSPSKDSAGLGKNVEQQLIDLLEAKQKQTG
jgi:hypothetical protein